jgi:hypothetical protein
LLQYCRVDQIGKAVQETRQEKENRKRDSRKSGKSHCMKRKRRERDKWNETLEENIPHNRKRNGRETGHGMRH